MTSEVVLVVGASAFAVGQAIPETNENRVREISLYTFASSKRLADKTPMS